MRLLTLLAALLMYAIPSSAYATETNSSLYAHDLINDQGLTTRILNINEEIANRLASAKPLSVDLLVRSVILIRNFLEHYRENIEDNYLAPRFEQRGVLTDLVKVIRLNHERARELTSYILTHANANTLKNLNARSVLQGKILNCVQIYRALQSREEALLFPTYHTLVTAEELAYQQELFDREAVKSFGEGGLVNVAVIVSRLEWELGIN